MMKKLEKYFYSGSKNWDSGFKNWDYSLILVYLSDTLLWSLAYPLHKFVQFYIFLVPVVVADFYAAFFFLGGDIGDPK